MHVLGDRPTWYRRAVTALFTFSELVHREAGRHGGDLVDASKWKLVRHIENAPEAPDFVDLFHYDREAVELYQAYQNAEKNPFGKCDGIFSFLGLPRSRALFIGGYRVTGARVGPLPEVESFPVELRALVSRWRTEVQDNMRYDLRRDERFASLEKRLVIDWGKSALSWHQWAVHEKVVVEIRDPNAIGDCPDYPLIDVSLAKLAHLYRYADANASWRERLSAVGGIYLLTDHGNAKLYVGQADGAGGFWSRWEAYARMKSGNVALDPAFADGSIRPDLARMCILEALPRSVATSELLKKRESVWKERLLSRDSGWNRN